MKKYLLLAGLLLCCIPSMAQKLTSGSLEPVFAQDKLNVTFDFSQASIDGIRESSLLNVGGDRAKDWAEGKENICTKFMLAMLPIVDNVISIGRFDDAPYTLVFIPKTFDDDGEVRGDAKVVDADGNVIAVISKINGDGGRWGTYMNLCGDAMEKAGTNVGRFLIREYNKIQAQARKAAKTK